MKMTKFNLPALGIALGLITAGFNMSAAAEPSLS